MKSVKDIVCPPAYKPTEQEHRIAYLEYILSIISYDYLLGIKMYKEDKISYKAGKKIESKEELEQIIKDRVDKFIKHYFGKWEESDLEVWETFIDYDEFKKTWGGEYLEESHCGDCNAHPCPCTRCHAEDKYKQDSSATWKDKYEGHKIYNEYIKEIRNDKQQS